MDDVTLGPLLRQLRQAAGLTLEQLSEASGVSDRAIGDMERGVSRAPRASTVTALATALQLTDDDRHALAAAARAGRQRELFPVHGLGGLPLPRSVADFTGRDDEIGSIVALAGAEKPARRILISGPPGIGKTSLALHAAAQLSERFPDGQYFLDLQALGPQPLTPFEVLARLIRAADPQSPAIPPALADATAMWHGISAGRRLLLVLDNAADEEQIRAALPGDGPALTIATSRRMLRGLDDIDRLPLAPLPEQQSLALLSRLTADRTAPAEQLLELARLCANVPLAMRVAGNRLASRRYWTVAHLIERLTPQERRLDALAAGDLQVNAAFALSYDQLSPDARRLFRRLPLAAGTTIATETAAVLMRLPVPATEDLLDELVEVSLLDEASPGRVRCHDLLRSFGERRLQQEEDSTESEEASRQLRQWLLATAIAAGRWFEPGPAPDPGAVVPAVASSPEAAATWLQAETDAWLAALHQAARDGQHRLVVEVAESLHWYSDRLPYWHHWHDVFTLSTQAAAHLGDDSLQATHLGYLAWTRLMSVVDPDLALQHADDAFEHARRAGDARQMGWACFYRSWALENLHRSVEEQVTASQQAAAYFTEARDWDGLPQALSNLNGNLQSLGRYPEALAVSRRILELIRDPATAPMESMRPLIMVHALGRVVQVHVELREWDTAVAVATEALQTSDVPPTWPPYSRILRWRAQAYWELGEPAAARADLEAALAIKKTDGDTAGLQAVEEELRGLPATP